MQEYFKIGEISRLYHIGVDSLRYYEKIGLLNPRRAESGYRYYSIQDIWKLNIIRDLRKLNFSMEQIGRYLQNHSLSTTRALLQEEQQAIGEQIRALEAMKENVGKRLEILQTAENLPMDQIELQHFEERRCFSIGESYQEEHEMDMLMKRLLNMDRDRLYLIGSNQMGTAISLKEAQRNGVLRYGGVFVIDAYGTDVIPAGSYLTVTYRGGYEKSRFWTKKLLDYGKDQGLTLRGDLLEILWVDIHVTEKEEEYITQLQVLTE